jgi:hypothetical protein
MSLRTELRAAIDEVSPPAPSLAHDTMAFVFPHEATPVFSIRRSRFMHRRFGRVGTMVAAVAVLALMGSLIVGGRLWRDLNSSPSPAQSIHQTELSNLEARQLKLPAVAAGAACPAGPHTLSMFGTGPVRFEPGLGPLTSWGQYYNGVVLIDSAVQGLVLFRARDLRTGEVVVFIGPDAIGRGLGSDEVGGRTFQQRSELAIETTSRASSRDAMDWGFMFGTHGAGARCVGWQVDGPGFSEVFVTKGA